MFQGFRHYLGMDDVSLDLLVEKVVGAAYEVANVLGCGFLEKVYERALVAELGRRGLKAVAQVQFPVVYKQQLLGNFVADVLVEERLLVEVKCVPQFSGEHLAQTINYLRAGGLGLGLLVNFQRSKVDWKRVIFSSAA